MQLGFPFRVDGRGATASADAARHARDLIEQVLFTTPGERVNRPEFGSGLLDLVFSGVQEAGVAVQVLVRSSLQRWLAEVVDVEDVRVERFEEGLVVHVDYRLRDDGVLRQARFERGL